MKFLYFTLFLFFTGQAFSQSDTIFPNNGADWRVRAWQFDELTGDPIPMTWLYYNVHLDNDAVLEAGKIWNTVREEEFEDAKGRIAIDSGKVYFQSYDTDYPIEGTGTDIFVLYDFNLEVGDTAYYTEDFAVVSEITTSTILGEDRTTLVLENGDEWIYGLGSNQGLYRPLYSVFEFAFNLCEFNGSYIDSLAASYDLSITGGADCFSGIEENVSPVIISNPNSAFESLFVNNLSDQNQSYSLINMSGKRILNGNLLPGNNIISVDILATGIYVFQVADYSQKLFISH